MVVKWVTGGSQKVKNLLKGVEEGRAKSRLARGPRDPVLLPVQAGLSCLAEGAGSSGVDVGRKAQSPGSWEGEGLSRGAGGLGFG